MEGWLHALAAIRHPQRQAQKVVDVLSRVRLPPLLPFAFAARGYTRNLLFRSPVMEVLVLLWSRGARTPIHDHAGQECWMLPLHGAFDLEDFSDDLTPLGSRRGVRSLDWQPGGAQIHRVSVVEPAVSLHVYASPVDFCRIFHGREVSWKRLHYDGEAHEIGI